MLERMKQSYVAKRYLEERSHGNVLKQPGFSYPLGEAAAGELEALECQLEEEFSAGTFGSSRTLSYQFHEALENFTQKIEDEPEQRSLESGIERRIRTSYESLQSLRRRINERKAKKGQKLREYSYEELAKYIFIKRLSVGSLPSNRSTTSSLLSKRSSDASESSTFTHRSSRNSLSITPDESLKSSENTSPRSGLADTPVSTRNTLPAKPLRHLFEARRPKPAPLKANISEPAIQFTTNMAFSPSSNFDQRHSWEEHDLWRHEKAIFDQELALAAESTSYNFYYGKYHLRPTNLAHFFQADTTPTTPNQLPRQMCCVNQCRGDPRADKCLFCLFDIPDAHFFVRSLVEQWRAGEDIFTVFAAKPVAINFGEVDDFGDTVLHLASSLGAGSLILCWFIGMGVSVNAKNAAGQTFMHCFNATSFSRGCSREASRFGTTDLGEDMAILLDTLQGMNFDFNAQDDFGQTPMHVLTRYWLPADTMQLALEVGVMGGSSLFSKDFLGRSVESQIRAKANVDRNGIIDLQRAIKVDALLHLMKPLAAIPTHQENTHLPLFPHTKPEFVDLRRAPHPHTALRKIIIKATSGFP